MPIWHSNFKSLEFRPGRPGNSQRFMAADGSAVAAAIGAVVSGQLTSLTKNVGGVGYAGPYPTGTRRTANCIVRSATGRVARVRFRNIAPGITDVDITQMLLGLAGAPGGAPIVALGAPPFLPGTTEPIVSCTVAIATLL